MSAKNLKNRALYHFRNQSVNEFSVVPGGSERPSSEARIFSAQAGRKSEDTRASRSSGGRRAGSPGAYVPAGRKF